MNTYLTIITTALVLTQVIRVTQNQVSLRRQERVFDNGLKITKEDFENQRRFYKLAIEKMEREKEGEAICLEVGE